MKSRHSIPFENFGLERTKPLESLAFFLLLAFVVAAPLPWGAVLPGGKLKIELFAFAIATILLVSRAPLGALRAIAVPTGALALLALVGAMQFAPIGAAAVKAIAPFSSSVYEETNVSMASMLSSRSAAFLPDPAWIKRNPGIDGQFDWLVAAA